MTGDQQKQTPPRAPDVARMEAIERQLCAADRRRLELKAGVEVAQRAWQEASARLQDEETETRLPLRHR